MCSYVCIYKEIKPHVEFKVKSYSILEGALFGRKLIFQNFSKLYTFQAVCSFHIQIIV